VNGAQWLTAAGLVVNMVGVALVFVFGFPQPAFRGDSLVLESSPGKSEVDAQRATHTRRSKTGLGLLVAGFVLQLAGTVVA
jgi:hypothetical protein